MTFSKTKYVTVLVLSGLFFVILFRSVFFSYKSNVTEFQSINIRNIDNLQNDSVIYIGRETCSSCQMFVPVLSDALKKHTISNKKVYYLDTDKARKEDPIQLQKFVHVKKIKSVPTMGKIENGKWSFKNFTDKSDIKDVTSFLNERNKK